MEGGYLKQSGGLSRGGWVVLGRLRSRIVGNVVIDRGYMGGKMWVPWGDLTVKQVSEGAGERPALSLQGPRQLGDA